jgi:hypothetical protein
MTPRWPIGVCQGAGGSSREFSLPPIGRLGVIYDPSRSVMPVYIAARIRVKAKST